MSERSDRWHATRRARELALFSGKRFEVVGEVKGESFKTPLGYSAKTGYEVRNVETNETFKVGKTTLKRMAEEYDSVTLPAPKKRGRPKKLATGGIIHGPGGKGDDTIPAFISPGCQYFTSGEVKKLYGEDTLNKVNGQENGNEPGAHPVAEEPTEDARSGSLAGPTYPNPNADETA